jgi:hypothetical protein
VFALAGLLTRLPEKLFSRFQIVSGWAETGKLALLLLAYALISLPFDWMGGYFLPRKFGRTSVASRAFWVGWLRGIFGQGALLFCFALSLLYAGREFGPHLGVLAVLLGMTLLWFFQVPIAWLVSGVRLTRAEMPDVRDRLQKWGVSWPSVVLIESSDPGFVGGFASLGQERILLPAAWVRALSAETVALQLVRRLGVLETGSRMRGVALAMGFNMIGFYLATLLPGADILSLSGLLTVVLGFTLWSFFGLLFLPTLSRGGVFEADRYALDKGIPIPVLERAMIDLDRLQDDEPSRSRLIETIFHPIPSVESRIARLANPQKPRGAWHAARMALYFSWACLGLLSRAVHCNSGRPELWVFFPGD